MDCEEEIEQDALEGTYVSEIDAIYDQLGGRLVHLNAMLANLPPVAAVPDPADATASEIVYADLATSPSTTFDVEPPAPPAILALPAPPGSEISSVEPLVEMFADIVRCTRLGELQRASRSISELFDIRPSHARRGAEKFARQLAQFPELARRLEHLGRTFDHTNEYTAATLLGECFDFQPIDALLLVRAMKQNPLNHD